MRISISENKNVTLEISSEEFRLLTSLVGHASPYYTKQVLGTEEPIDTHDLYAMMMNQLVCNDIPEPIDNNYYIEIHPDI